MTIRAVLVMSLIAGVVYGQDARDERVMTAVRAAIAPGLAGFPDTEEDGAMPVRGNTDALWMVRPHQPGDRVIEVHANPLNEVNQLKAARAMAQIERNIEAAERKASAQYERAVEEARRTGKSQEVDGITLSDEGVAGAKIDAESRVIIEVAFNQPAYKFDITTSTQPAPSTGVPMTGGFVITSPSNTYRDAANVERYSEAETLVFLGRVTPPQVQKRADHSYEVSTTPIASANDLQSVVLRFRGNEALIADLMRKANWGQLQAELLR